MSASTLRPNANKLCIPNQSDPMSVAAGLSIVLPRKEAVQPKGRSSVQLSKTFQASKHSSMLAMSDTTPIARIT